MDFSCEVDGCANIQFRGLYCVIHTNRAQKYGSATPLTNCFGCNIQFIWIKPALNTEKYCDKCLDLMIKYSKFIPKRRSVIYQHGITIPQYLNLLMNQNFECAIPSCKSKDKLCIDHDHRCCSGSYGCGKCVRGLICYKCNTLAGYMENSPDLLREVENYLERYRAII